jgi:hypothetical protein
MNTIKKTEDLVWKAHSKLNSSLEFSIYDTIFVEDGLGEKKERSPNFLEKMKREFLGIEEDLNTIAKQIIALLIERKRLDKWYIPKFKKTKITKAIKTARSRYWLNRERIMEAKYWLSEEDRCAIKNYIKEGAFDRSLVFIEDERMPWVDEDIKLEAETYHLKLYSKKYAELYDVGSGCMLPKQA